MKKIIKLFLLFFIALAGCFSFCTNEKNSEFEMDNEIDINIKHLNDAKEAILGKWELVLLKNGRTGGALEKEQEYTPTGYVEYLPDGYFGWYDYSTKKFSLYEGKYWIDKKEGITEDEREVEEGWVLHYENPHIFDEEFGDYVYLYDYFLSDRDKPHGINFLLFFNNKNSITLNCIDLISIVGTPDYIYKRKK